MRRFLPLGLTVASHDASRSLMKRICGKIAQNPRPLPYLVNIIYHYMIAKNGCFVSTALLVNPTMSATNSVVIAAADIVRLALRSWNYRLNVPFHLHFLWIQLEATMNFARAHKCFHRICLHSPFSLATCLLTLFLCKLAKLNRCQHISQIENPSRASKNPTQMRGLFEATIQMRRLDAQPTNCLLTIKMLHSPFLLRISWKGATVSLQIG